MNKTTLQAKAVDVKKPFFKWMLVSLLSMASLLVASRLLAAEINPFEKNYQAQNTGNLVSKEANPDTKMYVSNHKNEDNISMLESGYDMMGSSGFEAGDTPPELALQHAKAIKADTVLVYSKFATTKSAVSKIQMIKEAAKKGGGEVDAKDLEAEATRYNYYASYWAKLPRPLLGVHVIKLVPKQSDDAPAAVVKGLTILAVIKDSPAAKAGLVRGDVLTKIADVELNKPEELSALVGKNQGKNVVIEYERAAAKVATKAQINSR